MKRTFLAKLQVNAWYALIGALLLLVGVPLYQALALLPSGYGEAVNSLSQTLAWIGAHPLLFLGYRVLLISGFALMIALPFTLLRIILAQELLGREDEEEIDEELDEESNEEPEDEEEGAEQGEQRGMPEFAWRGRGFAVFGAWLGALGLFFFAGGTLAGTLYLVSGGFELTGLFAILTYTVGGGLLALSTLFFGLVIARAGRKLWPDSWVYFGYVALAVGALLSGSAVEVAFASTSGQTFLSTPAILLFAVWALWFVVMVIRLRPE